MKRLIIIILFCLAISSRAEAQLTEPVIIWAEDAAGNRDTVFIYGYYGKNPPAGVEEVDIYGVPPQGDLDLRIIERTDTNGYYLDTKEPVWLSGYFYDPKLPGVDGDNYGWLRPYSSNADYKKKYFSNYFIDTSYTGFNGVAGVRCAVYCYATNYPVTIGLCRLDYNDWVLPTIIPPAEMFTVHYLDNGSLAKNYYDGQISLNCEYGSGLLKEDYIILIELLMWTSIFDNVDAKTLHPNPTSDYVVLDDIPTGIYNILNNVGRIVDTFTIETIPKQINVSTLPNGTYFITDTQRKYLFNFIKTGGVK
jgi:hypothetical protein